MLRLQTYEKVSVVIGPVDLERYGIHTCDDAAQVSVEPGLPFGKDQSLPVFG